MRKDLILLILIVVIVIGVAVFLVNSSRKEQIYFELNTKKNISFLIIVENETNKLLSMQEIFINMKTGNIGFLDIPIYTGYEDLKGNVSWFEDLYEKNRFESFLSKVSNQLNYESDYYIKLTKENFIRLVDYLEGIKLLVSNSVEIYNSNNSILMPSGISFFDGDKSYEYLSYYRDAKYFNERSEFFKELFSKILSESPNLTSKKEYFSKMYSFFETNLSELVLNYIIKNYKINNDKVMFINIKGQEEIFKDNNGSSIQVVFPYYGGTVLKESIENLNKNLINEGKEDLIKIVVFNGTTRTGLAKNTADIYASLKFKVVKFSNADKDDYDKTIIIDNVGNLETSGKVAEVIRSTNVEPMSEYYERSLDLSEINPDVIVILGDDFDGRYVKNK